jgi:hypothetical protein
MLSLGPSKGSVCALCGGSPAGHHEQVHVSFETKANLLAGEQDLKRFGVTLETIVLLRKPESGPSPGEGLALAVSDDPFDQEELRELVEYLQFVGIPKDDILRLRLAEPEQIAGL